MFEKLLKSTAALALVLGCASCGGSNTVSGIVNRDVITAEDGYAEGGMGDTMGTAWFNLTVNSAELVDSYGSVQPDAGEELLVVNVSMQNTFGDSVLMFDSDFQAQWGSEGDEDYRYPLTINGVAPEKNMLASEYNLDAGKTVTGDLVFSVPGGMDEYSLSFMEYFAPEEEGGEDTPGDLFFIYFKAE